MQKFIKYWYRNKINLLICFSLYLIVFNFESEAQTIAVQGKITSSRFPVREASVTFTDNADTTNKISVLTDEAGDYQINLNITSVGPVISQPTIFELEQNYPNPFSSSTIIPYEVNKQSDIEVTIYDILGRVVRKFNVGLQSVGTYSIQWDGINSFGQRVTTGIYFYQLHAEGQSLVKKMIFNSGGKNFVPVPEVNHSQMLKTKNDMSESSLGGNFNIRIENTESTFPVIVPTQFDNVQVNVDTTINLSVDYLTTASVNLDSLHQIIRGFGASNVILWRPDMTESEVVTAFGTGDGQVGFSILRIMIEADTNRWNLYVPRAKQAYEMGATIIASPWFAPQQMVESVGGVSRVRYDMYNEYATHLNSFVTYMSNNGVPIYGISIQNEPDITDQWTSWTANEIFTFMKENANAITGTKVMAPESFQFNRTFSDPILNDSSGSANTDIICGHVYGGGLSSYPLALEKGKEVWMTEYLINSGNPPANLNIDTGWAGAMQTAENINDCMIANMSTYVWWNIVRYYGPIADGTYANKGDVTKKGFVMSQFSKFIRPGFYRVESSVFPSTGGVNVTAYRDSLSTKTVIVAINTSSVAQEVVFTVLNGSMNTFTPYITNEFQNFVQGDLVDIVDNKFTITLEASSITTFVSQ